MRLSELASVSRWLPDHPTAADRFWQRETMAVSEGEIELFYARAGLDGLRNEAIQAIDALQAAVIISSFEGELREPPTAIVLHEPPTEPFMVDELVDGLVKLRPPRRQACLYALESGCTPEQAMTLVWKDATKLKQVTPLVAEILQAAGRTRHVKLPYVFWEWATTQIATPLLELQWSIEQAFGFTWPKLVERHRRMVKVSRAADATSLLALASR